MTYQDEMDRTLFSQAVSIFHPRFWRMLWNKCFMGQGKICFYFYISRNESISIQNKIDRTPAALQILQRFMPQKCLYVHILTAAKRFEGIKQSVRIPAVQCPRV